MQPHIDNPKLAVYLGDNTNIDFLCLNKLKRYNIPVTIISKNIEEDDRFLYILHDIEALEQLLKKCGYREKDVLYIVSTKEEISRNEHKFKTYTWEEVNNFLELKHLEKWQKQLEKMPYDLIQYEKLLNSGNLEAARDVLRTSIFDIDVRIQLVEMLVKTKKYEDTIEAIALCNEPSSKNVPELRILLSKIYYESDLIPKDLNNAIRIIENVNLDYASKNYLYLISLYKERNDPGDCEKVLNICTSKCNIQPFLLQELGKLYDEGLLTERDISKSIFYFEKASQHNLGYSKNRLVDLYIERNVGDDYEKAFKTCSSFSNAGNPWATGRLARMYRDGIFVDKDVTKAAELMHIAANAGVKWARKEYNQLLYQIYSDDSLKFEKNKCYSVEDALELIKTGNIDSSLSLLKTLFGTSQDSQARIMYADLIIEDQARSAFDILNEAQDKKNPQICGRLARIYRDGVVVNKDLNKSIELYRIASDANIKWARLELPDVLINSGGKGNIEESIKILLIDAIRGVVWSQIKLARLYASGEFLEKDETIAKVLLRSASEQGNGTAKKELNELERRSGIIFGGLCR